MYKNQLQELAQRSCFNLPSYSCIREGPDHAPRFKAKVNFNGETFESPNFFSTLRQAEHASAEVALKTLSQKGPSRALAARVLDETGVYKNLLQETAHRAGLNLPVYTTIRSGVGGAPLFACTVELAGMSFKGEPAKTKKQAQKSAAMAAWFSLKKLSVQDSSFGCTSDDGGNEEQEQISVASYLSKFKLTERRKPPSKPPAVRNDVIPYTYFPLSPEVAASYQNWHHGMTTPRSYLLTSPHTPPLSILGPQFFPFVQSIFSPYTFPSDPLIQSGPFLYMAAGDMVPTCTSRVRIEEIEVNSQFEEEWHANNVSSQGQTFNREDLSWVPPGFLRNNTGAIKVDRAMTPCSWRSSHQQSTTRRPTLLYPETSHSNRSAMFGGQRTGSCFPSRPSRPWLERSRLPFGRAMAPAVQIRSVVPVCSAAPAQRGPPHNQVASSSKSVATRTEETSNSVSAADSEFSRLQL
ncbi:unnamed protein product [Cuscuta epithymum]|uniref:DRBM domain-containing protein n=1 Tax=Cuscuta epithymum TaxID=186058 RepID=A0AAV0CXB1_9ASTE|nr:unnamed protein product [Cuscuta epithymum]